jgi:hypothetical protein
VPTACFPLLGCRVSQLQSKSYDWHMNEVSLYGSQADDTYSSHPCTNTVVTLMMLRDPDERVTSHVSHLKALWETSMRANCLSALKIKPDQFPKYPKWVPGARRGEGGGCVGVCVGGARRHSAIPAVSQSVAVLLPAACVVESSYALPWDQNSTVQKSVLHSVR